ncbi:MAG: hypothetical protein Q9207_000845 [Kuettlingeria erythrocarpa]
MPRSSFFAFYANFRQDPRAPLIDEFRRLAREQGWAGAGWKIKRRECFLSEFELHLGSIEVGNKLDAWQNLCRELNLNGNLRSITQCKKALKGVHVNIHDLLDARRLRAPVQTFPTASALAQYTRETRRYFPLDEAKRESLIKILLKHIHRERR